MENIKLLRLYRKSLAKDSIAVKILSYIMLSNSLTEKELKERIPNTNSQELRNKLIELYKANFIRSISEDLWTTTNISEYVLSELSVPDSLIVLLARELNQSKEDVEFFDYFISTYYKSSKTEKDIVLSNLRSLLIIKPYIEDKFDHEEARKLIKTVTYSCILFNSELLGDTLETEELNAVINKYLSQRKRKDDRKVIKFMILNACESAVEASKASNKNILDGNLSGNSISKYYTIVRYYSTFFTGELDNYFFKSISLNFDQDDYIKRVTNSIVTNEIEIASSFSSSLSRLAKKWLVKDLLDFTLSTIPLFSTVLKSIYWLTKEKRDTDHQSVLENTLANQSLPPLDDEKNRR